MPLLSEPSLASARPLPVVLLADISGSMVEYGKIDALNTAVAEMLASFGEEDDARVRIHVAVITFGEEARLHQPFAPAVELRWQPMAARGTTPLGAALTLATTLIEDRGQIPSRAYRPTIILVSDGIPNDDWHAPLARLHSSERAAKATRHAMAIGDDADHSVLREFLGHPNQSVFSAHDARTIRKFFRWVTMTVVSRSRSVNPNAPLTSPPIELSEFEF